MADVEKENKLWGIHTDIQNDKLFLEHGYIAIGLPEMGDLSKISPDRYSFKNKYEQVFSNAKKKTASAQTGMLYRFCHEVQSGDYVVFPSKSDRMINIGKVYGEYQYDSTQGNYVNKRSVKWLKHVPRTAFTQGALYEIGSALTFFMVKNYADEYFSALDEGFKPSAVGGNDDTVGTTAEEIIDNTKDFVLKELSRNLKGYALEEFVANLLQAMGYRTKVSAQGGDRGIDIIAYKDELPPRIVVQVKSQDDDIKESTILSLKGAMQEGDYGLFVTLSDYTKNAKNFLESHPVIRGINGTELVDLIFKYYDDLDEKYQQIIPLKMVYIPVQKED